jgi:hypothetical protein
MISMISKNVRRIAGVVVTLPLLTGCEGKLVPLTATFSDTFDFTFDSNSGTSDIASLSADEITDAFDVDDDDAFFDRFDVQLLELTLRPGAGNAATSATLRFSYGAQNVTGDLPITVANLDDQPILNLNTAGITALRNAFEAILAGSPGAPSSVTVTGQVLNIQPPSARLVLDATVAVTATATFMTCQTLGLGPLGP